MQILGIAFAAHSSDLISSDHFLDEWLKGEKMRVASDQNSNIELLEASGRLEGFYYFDWCRGGDKSVSYQLRV